MRPQLLIKDRPLQKQFHQLQYQYPVWWIQSILIRNGLEDILLKKRWPSDISLIHAINEWPLAQLVVPFEDKGVQWKKTERKQQQEEEQWLEKNFQQIIKEQRQKAIPYLKHQPYPKLKQYAQLATNWNQQKQLEVKYEETANAKSLPIAVNAYEWHEQQWLDG
jgi:predicted ATP-binding protein involved in virulence